MYVLHPALQRWQHALLLLDRQRAQPESYRRRIALRREFLPHAEQQLRLERAMRAAGLPWEEEPRNHTCSFSIATAASSDLVRVEVAD